MGGRKFRGFDDALGWINREFADIRRELRELRAARSLESSSIGKGGLTVTGEGGIRMIAPDGTVIFEVFCNPNNPDPEGNPQPTLRVFRNDGTLALLLEDPLPLEDEYHQILRIFDRNGREIFAEDTTSGTGIATPWLSASMYPARYTDWLKSTSGTFETIWQGQFQAMNPCLSLAATYTSDESATTGDVRFTVNDVAVGDTQDVAFVIGAAYLANQVPLPAGLEPGDFITIKLQAKRTAGTGKVCCAPYSIQGAQSA